MLRQTKKHRYFHSSLLLLLYFIYITTAKAGQWEIVAPGIEYRDIAPNPLTPWSHVHVFRINLKEQTLDLVTADELSRKHASAEEMGRYRNALIAINGGFFDTEYRPLGLRVGHNREFSHLKSISWWGVFYVTRKKPHLIRSSQFKAHEHEADFAIQSGPRLLVKGKSPKLKPGIAERTALGITRDNHVIILVTEHAPMSTSMLADVMQSFPLYCTDALNLDGGSSTQVYANVGNLHLSPKSALGVSDAVIVKPRQ